MSECVCVWESVPGGRARLALGVGKGTVAKNGGEDLAARVRAGLNRLQDGGAFHVAGGGGCGCGDGGSRRKGRGGDTLALVHSSMASRKRRDLKCSFPRALNSSISLRVGVPVGWGVTAGSHGGARGETAGRGDCDGQSDFQRQ